MYFLGCANYIHIKQIPVQELNSRALHVHNGMYAFMKLLYFISTDCGWKHGRMAHGRIKSTLYTYMLYMEVRVCSFELHMYMRACHSTKVFPKKKYTASK